MLGPRVRPAKQSIAKLIKRADPFYLSPEWKETRARVLERDGHRCTIRGCERRAFICDHIISRKAGGSDDESNLRSLCRVHDNARKENHLGERRGTLPSY
jgi:5-methylcytosine-specific restriction endonuclease McrA